ncbi:hypothetical protein TRFO_41094 [Tritrichomonas foetus]|uniref:Uncharacterized protein n=1 Tax=Tritrichomonas foetus TaxID=1144522 RepID=A0A1J4L2N5_9EUKA|nr:hypothetical protein TRFO_41094 [Tritrichomonas foetus]|eukprot:OHT17352.1 hypothetical protein TRFO_41094 [Tritrichomonas foetus]
MYILVRLGNIVPVGAMYLSLALMTDGSIDSYNKQYPIHSLMITSTGSGISMSSIAPFKTLILSAYPFFWIIFSAYSLIEDLSTA